MANGKNGTVWKIIGGAVVAMVLALLSYLSILPRTNAASIRQNTIAITRVATKVEALEPRLERIEQKLDRLLERQ